MKSSYSIGIKLMKNFNHKKAISKGVAFFINAL